MGADDPQNVIAAIARIMSELPGIGRDQRSEQGYQYRGIEAITAEAQALMGKYGVVFAPRVVDRQVKDLTINGRPWTQDELEVVYRVYGPGGLEDYFDAGPIIGLGRDNSDKGCNKAMTQAFKYALIQVFCIGDRKDDPDAGPAHEADPHQNEPDPAKEVRDALGRRVRGLSPEQRQEIRQFCDDNGIPRVPAQMTDDQVEFIENHLDLIVIGPPDDGAPFDTPGERAAAVPAELNGGPPQARSSAPDDVPATVGTPEPSQGHTEPVPPLRWMPVEDEPIGPVASWRPWVNDVSKDTATEWLAKRDLPTSGTTSVLRVRMLEHGHLRAGAPADA